MCGLRICICQQCHLGVDKPSGEDPAETFQITKIDILFSFSCFLDLVRFNTVGLICLYIHYYVLNILYDSLPPLSTIRLTVLYLRPCFNISIKTANLKSLNTQWPNCKVLACDQNRNLHTMVDSIHTTKLSAWG